MLLVLRIRSGDSRKEKLQTGFAADMNPYGAENNPNIDVDWQHAQVNERSGAYWLPFKAGEPTVVIRRSEVAEFKQAVEVTPAEAGYASALFDPQVAMANQAALLGAGEAAVNGAWWRIFAFTQNLSFLGAWAAWLLSGLVTAASIAFPIVSVFTIPFFIINSVQTVGVLRYLRSKYPADWTKRLEQPIGKYDLIQRCMVDTETGLPLYEAPWFVLAHEQFAHRWAHSFLNGILSPWKLSLEKYAEEAAAGRRTAGYYIWNLAASEFFAHMWDLIAAPLAMVESFKLSSRWEVFLRFTAVIFISLLTLGLPLLFAALFLGTSIALTLTALAGVVVAAVLISPLWLDLLNYRVLRKELFLPRDMFGLKTAINSLLFRPNLSVALRQDLLKKAKGFLWDINQLHPGNQDLDLLANLMIEGLQKGQPELDALVEDLTANLIISAGMGISGNFLEGLWKRLDRLTDPVQRYRLIHLMANNWGSSVLPAEVLLFARRVISEFENTMDTQVRNTLLGDLERLARVADITQPQQGEFLTEFLASHLKTVGASIRRQTEAMSQLSESARDQDAYHRWERAVQQAKEEFNLTLRVLHNLVDSKMSSEALQVYFDLTRDPEQGLFGAEKIREDLDALLPAHLTSLEPFVAKGEKVVLDFWLERLEPKMQNQETAVWEKAVAPDVEPGLILDVLMKKSLALGNPAAMLLLKCHQNNERVLRAVIESPDLDMRHRLFALTLYTTRFLSENDAPAFRALIALLNGPRGDGVHNYIQNFLLKDQTRVQKIFSTEDFRNDELMIYCMAVWADTVASHPKLPLQGFTKIAKVIRNSKAHLGYENANSFFQIGAQLIKLAKNPAAFLVATLAHELMHNILKEGLEYPFDDLKAGTIHEFLADALAKALMQRYPQDISMAEYEDILDFQDALEGSAHVNFKIFEAHYAARAQDKILQRSFELRDIPLRYDLLVEAAVNVLQVKHLRSERAARLFRRFFRETIVLTKKVSLTDDQVLEEGASESGEKTDELFLLGPVAMESFLNVLLRGLGLVKRREKSKMSVLNALLSGVVFTTLLALTPYGVLLPVLAAVFFGTQIGLITALWARASTSQASPGSFLRWVFYNGGTVATVERGGLLPRYRREAGPFLRAWMSQHEWSKKFYPCVLSQSWARP